VILEDGERLPGQATLAADGAFSRVRNALVRSVDFNYSQHFLTHRYKELSIPPAEGDKVGWRLTPHDALHIWPRGTFMLIGLPNVDGSFTMTLFAPKETFAALTTPAEVTAFFEREFADAVPLMPTLTDDFFANPTGALVTIRCSPWDGRGPTVLLGDAAHAIVPFFGQGMNCALEDVRVLGDMLDEEGTSSPVPWASLLHRFSEARVPDAHAIADMAVENYVEMRDTTAKDSFGILHQLEHELTRRFGADRFLGRYERVSFTNQPYRTAQAAGKSNHALLVEIAQGATSLDEIDWAHAEKVLDAASA
jgi:kynurenine 3-monooxygenase